MSSKSLNKLVFISNHIHLPIAFLANNKVSVVRHLIWFSVVKRLQRSQFGSVRCKAVRQLHQEMPSIASVHAAPLRSKLKGFCRGRHSLIDVRLENSHRWDYRGANNDRTRWTFAAYGPTSCAKLRPKAIIYGLKIIKSKLFDNTITREYYWKCMYELVSNALSYHSCRAMPLFTKHEDFSQQLRYIDCYPYLNSLRVFRPGSRILLRGHVSKRYV